MDRRQFLKLAGGAALGPAVSRMAGNDVGSVRAHAPARVAQQTMARPKYGPDPHPATRPAPVTRKVLVNINNPLLPSQGNVRLRTYFGWNDPDWLVANHISDLQHASFGYVNYVVAERIQDDDFARWPVLHNGFRHNEHSYLEAVRTRTEPSSLVNYSAYMDERGIIERVSSGQIDEVWDIGVGYVGMWEAVMAGPGATNSNAPPLGGTDHAGRRFVIMAYNYGRGLSEMLHSYGHRAEGHLSHALRNVPERDNLWRRFLRHDLVTPGMAELGNVHFPPNGVFDADYRNQHKVQSNADDWYHYPWLTGDRFRKINCEEWSTNNRLYLLWWFRHMPHIAGYCDGIAHNWWRYIVDPNTY